VIPVSHDVSFVLSFSLSSSEDFRSRSLVTRWGVRTLTIFSLVERILLGSTLWPLFLPSICSTLSRPVGYMSVSMTSLGCSHRCETASVGGDVVPLSRKSWRLTVSTMVHSCSEQIRSAYLLGSTCSTGLARLLSVGVHYE
jgi:hypothetical protein